MDTNIIQLSKAQTDFLMEQSNNIWYDSQQNPKLFCDQISELKIIINANKINFNALIVKISISPTLENNITLDTFKKIQALLNYSLFPECEMVSFEGENSGSLFQTLTPKKEMAHLQISAGSSVELEIHTEQAFSELRPDILSLACFRGLPDAETYFLSIDQLLNHLSEEEIQIMFYPLWTIQVDLSFILSGKEGIQQLRGPIPMLVIKETKKIEWVFDQDLMQGITEEAQTLLQKIIQIYRVERKKVILGFGDFLFLNNTSLVHGRSPFQPTYNDKTDRVLTRSFMMSSLRFNKYVDEKKIVLNSRMVLAEYS